jgi:hypothetical protein
MLTTCQEPGCTTIVMGGRCLEHERRSTRVFVRGRPFVGGAPNTARSGYRVGTLPARADAPVPESAQLAFALIPRR